MTVLSFRYIFLGLLMAVPLFMGLTHVTFAQAIPSFDLNGYAWSDTIGWISLNCATGSAVGGNICGTSNYKVTVNSDRTITGYAWAPNIGWIRFGGLSSFPVGWTGTASQNAAVTGAYPDLSMVGFARACAATLPGDCSSMTAATSTTTGGWDGWIAFSGSTLAPGSYLVSLDATAGMNNNSYAWGYTNIGWINMWSRVSFASANASISLTDCDIAASSSSCTSTLTWNISTSTSQPNVYRQSASTHYSSSTSGSNSISLTRGTHTFQARSAAASIAFATADIQCVANTTWNGSICAPDIIPTPTISISAQPPLVRGNNSSLITWTITPSPLTTGTCSINGSGITAITGTTTSGSVAAPTLSARGTYRITCTGGFGSVSATTTVDVVPTGQEV